MWYNSSMIENRGYDVKTLKEFVVISIAIIMWVMVYHLAAEWDLLDATKVEYQHSCAGEVKIDNGLVICAEGQSLRKLGAI